MRPFVTPLMLGSHVVLPPFVDDLESFTGWTQTDLSVNDNDLAGSVTVQTSNPFSGSSYFRLFTRAQFGGTGDVGRSALSRTITNLGYSLLRIAYCHTATTFVSIALSTGSLTFVSDAPTSTPAPSGTTDSSWREILYAISGAPSTFTLTLNGPAEANTTIFFDKLELLQ